MNITTRYFYKKADKLKSRKAIDEIFGKGRSFSGFPIKTIWLPQNRMAALQAGVGVSSKNFKKATQRNRIKRLMREAFRLQKNDLQQYLLHNNKTMSVFFLYVGKDLPDYELLFEKIGTSIKRLIKLSNDNTQANT